MKGKIVVLILMILLVFGSYGGVGTNAKMELVKKSDCNAASNFFSSDPKSLSSEKVKIDYKKDKEPLNMYNFNWEWGTHGGSTYEDFGIDIDVDSDGNSYVTGAFNEIAYFDDIVVSSNGDRDLFVAKLDSNGYWLWVEPVGGTGWDQGNSICIGPDGDIYVTGFFSGTVYFGETKLTSKGYVDIFIAKIDPNGNWLWAKKSGGSLGNDGADSIKVDSNGNIYIEGWFYEEAYFGNIVISSYGKSDAYVAKLDSEGNWQWVIKCGGSKDESGSDMSIDSSGNVYFSGFFCNVGYFGDEILTSVGSADGFIAKLDTNGSWLWVNQVGGIGYVDCYTIITDSVGNIFVSGSFGDTTLIGGTEFTSYGLSDIFIARLDSDGNWQWVKQTGGNELDEGRGITFDSFGNVYVTGVFSDDAHFGNQVIKTCRVWDFFITKLDTNGNFLWTISPETDGYSMICMGYGIILDNEGNILTTGCFYGSVIFGNQKLTHYGHYDVFVAKSNAENEPPNIPEISGPKTGKPNEEYIYTIRSRDPEFHDVYYYIDWGDGEIEEWVGPYHSHFPKYFFHIWDKEGAYVIRVKARDSEGGESNWATLTVTMSRSRAINTPFLNVLQNYPILFQLFQRFFNLQ